MIKIRVEINEREAKHKIEKIIEAKLGFLKRLAELKMSCFLRKHIYAILEVKKGSSTMEPKT